MTHTKEELWQMQALPLRTKIKMSQQRILEWYEKHDGLVYVSFSGGKDSTVLKHLVETTPGIRERERESTVPSVFCDTGLEFPEVRRFAIAQPNVTVIKPKMRFDAVIQKYGWPLISKEVSQLVSEAKHTKSEALRNKRLHGVNGTRTGIIPYKWQFLIDAPFEISHKCCDVMKKRPFHAYEKETGRAGIVGVMAEESTLRLQSWMKYGCNAFDMKRAQSRPLMFWTEQDILRYIKDNGLEIAAVYGDVVKKRGKFKTTGRDRSGCFLCPYGVQSEEEPNRFQQLKETHPAQYKYCMDKLGLREVLDYIGVPYE